MVFGIRLVFGSKSVVPSGFLRSDIDTNKILKKIYRREEEEEDEEERRRRGRRTPTNEAREKQNGEDCVAAWRGLF